MSNADAIKILETLCTRIAFWVTPENADWWRSMANTGIIIGMIALCMILIVNQFSPKK